MTEPTKPIDEDAILAQMKTALEAEGMAASESPFPPGVKLDPCTAPTAPAAPPSQQPTDFPGLHPVSIEYLREVVALAAQAGITHLRTGSLEIRFDPDARKVAPRPIDRQQF